MTQLNQTILAGVDRTTLQQWLTMAQSAYNSLMTGRREVTVTYTQGDGQKSVTYAKADMAMLTQYIMQLQIQLGIKRGRRAITPFFSW